MSEKHKVHAGSSSTDENALVIAAKNGARDAFHSLYELYRHRIYALLYHICGDASLAEDLLQEVFLKVFKSLPRFRFESSFSTWIYRIAMNEAKYSRRQSKDSLPLDILTDSSLEKDGSQDELGKNISKQRQTIVRHAVLELAPKLRNVIVLKYVEGLSYEEIAEILECSSGTVASRLSRALQKLEIQLRPFEKIL